MRNRIVAACAVSLAGWLWLSMPGAAQTSAVVAPVRVESPRPTPADELFDRQQPLTIAVRIADAGIQALGGGRSFGGNTRPETEATVVEDGRAYERVSVHLKGFTSFQPITARPSLTLNFDKLAPKQTFHGLEKLSINNSTQDATRLNETFMREMFALVGVPVARAAFANVSLNERDLGLYVLTEGFDKRFLARHFARTDGELYEGGFLSDITESLERTSGPGDATDAGVARLIGAARVSDPAARFRALETALDLDRFITMVALETMLCHSDSYSMNKNNYRLYHDPATDKIVFIPHGMDQILGKHRGLLDLSLTVPRLGLVARALLNTTEGRRLYVARVQQLFDTIFRPDVLCRRASDIAARSGSPSGATDAKLMCDHITARAADLRVQLTDTASLLRITPDASFDAAGSATLPPWHAMPLVGQAQVTSMVERQAAGGRLHLHTTAPAVVASVRTRVNLPAGRYRLTGQVTAALRRDGTMPVPVAVTLIRMSQGRFDYLRSPLRAAAVDATFEIGDRSALEEIELACDVNRVELVSGADVWLDVDSLRITKVP